MHKTILLFAAAALAVVTFARPAHADGPTSPAPLPSYIQSSMLSWVRPAHRTDVDETRYLSIAEDIAAVVSEPGEAPIFKGDESRAKTALVLASIAFWESGFDPRVDAGARLGDDGHAISLFQLHVEQGGWMLEDDGGWIYGDAAKRTKDAAWLASHRVYRWTDLRGAEHRRDAARVALHVARQSIRAGAGLCQYSGEGADGKGCPKAATRLQHAQAWFASHPYAP